ncbi:MAG: hypothetical protein JST92_26530 [Deltaproteobacteria bacterium]|nr:hypothetical protein [Deltaproteobacteria bacterium]
MIGAFPLFGTAVVMLVVLPLVALAAKGALVLLERDQLAGPLHGLRLRYVVLIMSSVLPLAWAFSSGLHQAETGRAHCLLDRNQLEGCIEPELFAVALTIAVLLLSLRVVRERRDIRESRSIEAKLLAARLERLASRSELVGLRGRLFATDAGDFALGTHGLWRPRVFVGVGFARTVSDEMLASGLGHELEHVRGSDPLRYFLLQLSLAVNPLGRMLLGGHAARWQVAREAHCDREAVLGGAGPLSLADAIVRAARPGHRADAVALGTHNTGALKLRISLLLAFSERQPVRCCEPGLSAVAPALLVFVVVLFLPHVVSNYALDVLHQSAERALTHFWS